MKHVLLQLLLLIWHLRRQSKACAAQCYSAAHISLTTHAALVAHRLGGLDDAAEGLCITVVSDLQ